MRRLLPVALLLCCGRTDTPAAVAAPASQPEPAPVEEPLSLSATVQKKTRALTLDVSSTPSVARWTRKGDHIDVIGTFADPVTNERVTVTLVQNVIVLDADGSSLALLVGPEEAELITHASQTGSVTVSLRNPDDVDVIEERGRTVAQTLLSGERHRVLQQKRFSSIQIIRGSGTAGGGGGGGMAWAAPRPAPEPRTGLIVKAHAVNGVIATRTEPVSTFAADVDTASYALARAQLVSGHLPDPGGVRVEEFVNAFDHAYRAPEKETFGVTVDAFPSPVREGYTLLHVGVQGRRIDTRERKDANLVFTLDVSGSMEGSERLGLAKKALELLASQLTERDTVAIVVYGTEARLVLPPTSAREKSRIIQAINGLSTEGSTNVQAGLELAYSTALTGFKRGGINRVVLCSDGVANNGITDADGIFARVKSRASEGITLSAVGFGMGSYNDALMERLADQGDGNYAYVDKLDEAKRVFVQQLTGMLQVIAKDAKFQLTFDPAAVESYRLLGFENRLLAQQDFANDKVDAGDLGSGHSVTALYEVKLKAPRVQGQKLVTFRARFKEPGSTTSGLIEQELTTDLVRGTYEEASGAARLSTVVAAFGDKLRHGTWADKMGWQRLYTLYTQLPGDVIAKAEVVELGQLIRAAQKLDAPATALR